MAGGRHKESESDKGGVAASESKSVPKFDVCLVGRSALGGVGWLVCLKLGCASGEQSFG
jgi:hypothetical protein